MQYYKCRCGKSQSWTTMSVEPCVGCNECNTTLEQNPDKHSTPIPHELRKRFESNGTNVFLIIECVRCIKRIEKVNLGTIEEVYNKCVFK